MSGTKATMTLVGIASLCVGPAAAQQPIELTPQDHIDIVQLIDRYPYILDNCTNGGYDYADLYTPDGTFGVSSEWGSEGKIWYRGRDELAVAAGGGPDGCRRTPRTASHVVTSPVVTPTPTGASAKSTLIMIETAAEPPRVEWQGGYEDTFVKTPDGWRFKSRLHVWPGFDWPDTAAEMARRRAEQNAGRR